jgi:hypothetical protein
LEQVILAIYLYHAILENTLPFTLHTGNLLLVGNGVRNIPVAAAYRTNLVIRAEDDIGGSDSAFFRLVLTL